MKQTLFLLFLFPFLVSAQILEKQFVATVQYSGFTQINDSLFRGNLIEFRDVLIEGYQPSGVDSGFICLDGTGRAYRVEVVNSYDYSRLNVDLIELDDYDEIPIGVGIVAERFGSTYLIPNGVVNALGISSILQTKILNHNTEISAFDEDRDSTNELQNLVLIGTVLNITDGNAVDFASLLAAYLLKSDTSALIATKYYVGTNPTTIANTRMAVSNGSNLVGYAGLTYDGIGNFVMGVSGNNLLVTFPNTVSGFNNRISTTYASNQGDLILAGNNIRFTQNNIRLNTTGGSTTFLEVNNGNHYITGQNFQINSGSHSTPGLVIGSTTNISTSILTARSTTKSSSPFPLHTLAESDAITGVQGNFDYETTQNGLRGHNGTRKFYLPESTVARFTPTYVPFPNGNGQLTESGNILFNSATARFQVTGDIALGPNSTDFTLANDVSYIGRVGIARVSGVGGTTTFTETSSGNTPVNWLFSSSSGNNIPREFFTGESAVIRVVMGFANPNTDNNGTTFDLTPTHNKTNLSRSIIRGIRYKPTLTSMVNVNHRALEIWDGDVLFGLRSGRVSIGDSIVSPSSLLDVKGTKKGARLFPEMTTAKRDSIYKGILSVTVNTGGTGYVASTTFISTSGCNGSGAQFTPTVSAGVITAITVRAQGTNFECVPNIVITGAGTGATATATLTTWPIGLTIYNTTTGLVEMWNGSEWVSLTADNNGIYTGSGSLPSDVTVTGAGYDLTLNAKTTIGDSLILTTTPTHSTIKGLVTLDSNGVAGLTSLAGGLSYSGGVLTGADSLKHWSNVLFVSPNGNDGTAVKNKITRPWLTLDAAKTAALSGDLVVVLTGTYSMPTNLWKDGVDWHFETVTISGLLTTEYALSNCLFKATSSGTVNVTGNLTVEQLIRIDTAGVTFNAQGFRLGQVYIGGGAIGAKVNVRSVETTSALYVSANNADPITDNVINIYADKWVDTGFGHYPIMFVNNTSSNPKRNSYTIEIGSVNMTSWGDLYPLRGIIQGRTINHRFDSSTTIIKIGKAIFNNASEWGMLGYYPYQAGLGNSTLIECNDCEFKGSARLGARLVVQGQDLLRIKGKYTTYSKTFPMLSLEVGHNNVGQRLVLDGEFIGIDTTLFNFNVNGNYELTGRFRNYESDDQVINQSVANSSYKAILRNAYIQSAATTPIQSSTATTWYTAGAWDHGTITQDADITFVPENSYTPPKTVGEQFVQDTTLTVTNVMLNACNELFITSSMTGTAPADQTISFPVPSATYAGKRISVWNRRKDAGSFVPVIAIAGGGSTLYYTSNTATTAPADQATLTLDGTTWHHFGKTYTFTCTKINSTDYRWVLNQ